MRVVLGLLPIQLCKECAGLLKESDKRIAIPKRIFRMKIKSEIVVSEQLAAEANSAFVDMVEFAQTAAILNIFREKFGNSLEEYEQNLTHGYSRAVISTLISSMENSAIICLGRIFDDHKKSARLRDLVDRLPNTMKESPLGAGLAIIFLKGTKQLFDETDPIGSFSSALAKKIEEAESLYGSSGFCSLRNSHIGHANIKKRDDNAQALMKLEMQVYLSLASKLLVIIFSVKYCLNPTSEFNTDSAPRSAQNFINDTMESARMFIRDFLRVDNM